MPRKGARTTAPGRTRLPTIDLPETQRAHFDKWRGYKARTVAETMRIGLCAIGAMPPTDAELCRCEVSKRGGARVVCEVCGGIPRGAQ